MDCFAEPAIGRHFAPTRWLAIDGQRRVGHVDHAVLDRFIETLQLRFRFGRALAQLRDVPTTAFILFLTLLKQLIHHHRQTCWIEQPRLTANLARRLTGIGRSS